jgi:S1-C subfamily serine protease
MNLRKQQLGIYLSVLTIGTSAGIAASQYWNSKQSSDSSNSVVPVSLTSSPVPIAVTYPEKVSFVAKAVEKVGPAVVRIDADRLNTSLPDSWRYFFDKENTAPKENYEHGTGSGFIISSDGRILTNAHVIEGADSVKVTLNDGRTYTGKVIGRDTVTDVAVVKIEAENLPFVTFGKSENLVPGEWAIAIGNPFGLDNTVTVGIISAIKRSSSEVGVPNKRVSFIQTDAAINPGNSGGPLLNADGEVIGINTAIRANAQGLGFAIPIETAQRIAQQLVSKGKADHPYLGIQMTTLNAQVREELAKDNNKKLKITADKGVLIADIIPNSPAELAGLQTGDVILKVGGQPVATAAQVQDKVQASNINEDLLIEVDRQGKIKAIAVRPTNFPQ